MTDLLRCDPEHSSQLPIDLNLHCRIVEFLFVREIPQRWDAAQSVLDLLGILARLGEIRTAHGDLDRRRRPEAHDPTDYVVALEAEAHIRQFLRQHLPQPLLKFADANSGVAFELDLENRFLGSAGPQINGVDRIGRGWDPDKAQGDLDVAWASLARNDVEGPICDPVGLLDARAGGRAKPKRELAGINYGENLTAQVSANHNDDARGDHEINRHDRPSERDYPCRKAAIAVAEPIE